MVTDRWLNSELWIAKVSRDRRKSAGLHHENAGSTRTYIVQRKVCGMACVDNSAADAAHSFADSDAVVGRHYCIALDSIVTGKLNI